MDVTVWRDGFEYHLHFERGELVGELEKTPLPKSQAKKTGTRTRWLPDLDVFTDIAIPAEYFADVMKRQAVVNAGITFRFRNEAEPGKFEETEFLLSLIHISMCIRDRYSCGRRGCPPGR